MIQKAILAIYMIFSGSVVVGQEFSFQLSFEDAAGNKDTITLGYDPLATDSIDPAFGEVNIISVLPKPGLDVRITNEWRNRNFYFTPGTFHTKKQIVNFLCIPGDIDIQAIDVKTDFWPVHISWDTSLFHHECRNGSVFTSVRPGGWWDTGSPSDLWRQELRLEGLRSFSSNLSGGYDFNFGYIKDGDTIPVFWQSFGDSTILFISVDKINKQKQFSAFPNPFNELLVLYSNGAKCLFDHVELLSITGSQIMSFNMVSELDLSGLPAGVYLLRLTNSEKFPETIKVVRSE